MGCDLVQRGLKHDLPIDNPKELARVLAKRMNKNIKLGAYRWLYFDREQAYVGKTENTFIEFEHFKLNDSEDFLILEICNYFKREIRDLILKEYSSLDKVKYEESWIQSSLEYADDPFELYNIDRDGMDIQVSRESIDIDIDPHFSWRWFRWIDLFSSSDEEDRAFLKDYRKKIYEQAKIFGCDEVIFFGDQGPTELIFDRLDGSAEEIRDYINSYGYLDTETETDKEEWIKYSRHIQYAEAMLAPIALEEQEFIDIVFDDFRDIEEEQKHSAEAWVESAARVARRLHTGQVDKAGIPYFEGHLSSVAAMGRDWREQVVGYLHDSTEDTPNTVEEVLSLLEEEAQRRLSKEDRSELSSALHLLNHHKSPDRDSYIRAIGEHPLARAVKLNDLRHNMDLSRLPNPSPRDYERLERYKREFAFLSNYLRPPGDLD